MPAPPHPVRVACAALALSLTASGTVALDDEPLSAPAAPVPESPPPGLEPAWVRPLGPMEPGHNDGNPVWSPAGDLLAFERGTGEKKEIVIARPDGHVLQVVYFQLNPDSKDTKFFFPGVVTDSYNAGLTWAPAGDRLVFMSNGGEGNYDLYLQDLAGKTTRLTDHKEKDGHAHWSPVADQIVFVSGRTGKGDLYLLELGTRVLTQLTRGAQPFLYPQWSPDGKKIAVISGSNENHHVYVIDDVKNPGQTIRQLTAWEYDDLRPVWSPDGTKLALYSNYNPAGDPKSWSLLVIAADGSDPDRGPGLAAKVVATDVIPDVERGPAWLPGSAALAYVRSDRQAYNPIYVVDLVQHTDRPLRTETKMNHDVACSSQGVLAFRAQLEQWDHVFLAKLRD